MHSKVDIIHLDKNLTKYTLSIDISLKSMKWTNILTKNPLLADITKNLTGWKNGVFPEKSESNKTVNHSPSRNIINTLINVYEKYWK